MYSRIQQVALDGKFCIYEWESSYNKNPNQIYIRAVYRLFLLLLKKGKNTQNSINNQIFPDLI